MARITSISAQQKRAKRYNIFVDDTFKIGITEETLLKFHLHKGMPYTDELHTSLTTHVFYMKLYQKALNYLSYALRSEQEVRQTLYKSLEDPDESQLQLVEKIVFRLKNERYINDEQFVKSFIQHNFATVKKGPHALKQQLLKKGIAMPLIDSQLRDLDETVTHDNALIVAQKYLDKQKKSSQKAMYEKTRAYLVQRGYSFSIINRVLTQVDFNDSIEQEHDALMHHLDKLGRKYSKKYTGYDLKNKLFQALYQKGFDSHDIKCAISNYLEDNHFE